MSIVLSIIMRELNSQCRVKNFYLRRMAFVLAGIVILVFALSIASVSSGTPLGLELFTPMAYLLLVAACLAAPLSAAPLIVREKEERTFGLLMLSDIRLWQFLAGKLFASIFVTIIYVFTGLPLLLLCASFGGISVGQALQSIGVICYSVVFCVFIGLLVSSVSRKSLEAIFFTLLACVVPSIVSFQALDAALTGELRRADLVRFLASVILALMVFPLALLILRRSVTETGNRRRYVPSAAVLRRPVWAFRDNPVVVKESLSFVRPRPMLKIFLFVTVLSLCLSFYIESSTSGFRKVLSSADFLPVSLALIGVLSLGIYVFGVLTVSCTSFGSEKRSRSFDLLVISGLSESDIILGKLWASIRAYMPWLGIVLVAAGIFANAGRLDFTRAAVEAIAFLCSLPAIACISIYFSLRYRSGMAIALSTMISALLIAVFITLMCQDGLGGSVVVIIVGACLINLFLGKTFYLMRQLSTGEKTLA